MSTKRQSGSDENLGSRGKNDVILKHGDFRPRSSTLPTDVLHKLRDGRRRSREEHHTNGSRKQAWTAKTPEDTHQNNHFHLDCHQQAHYRARANTMPSSSESMRKGRSSPPSAFGTPPLNRHVASLSRTSKGQSGSLDALTTSKSPKEGRTNRRTQGDHSPRVHWASDDQLLDSTEHYINRCISIYSDESLAVQRDPLPKGSRVFEEVLHQIEREKTDLQSDKENRNLRDRKQTNGRKKVKSRAGSTHSPADSPKLHRHVHWKSASARK